MYGTYTYTHKQYTQHIHKLTNAENSIKYDTYIRINSSSNHTSIMWICLHTVTRAVYSGK